MAFYFLRKSKFLKNKRLIMFYCDSFIDKLEKGIDVIPFKSELMTAISKDIDSYESEIASYTEKTDNFKEIAMRTVSDVAFNLIQSGKYHLMGRFNSVGPGAYAAYIHKKAVKEFLDAGYITQEDYDEDLLALRDAINQRL